MLSAVRNSVPSIIALVAVRSPELLNKFGTTTKYSDVSKELCKRMRSLNVNFSLTAKNLVELVVLVDEPFSFTESLSDSHATPPLPKTLSFSFSVY